MGTRGTCLKAFGLVFLMALHASARAAPAYPSHAITMVVPFAAGGPTDTLARILAERMRIALGQPVIVENVVGAAGTIGVGRVVRAAADGYTLSIGPWNTHVVNGSIYDLPYDTLRDLEPIALLATNDCVIVSKKEVPAANLKDLVAWIKANQDRVSAGTGGVGAGTHIAGIMFQQATDTHFQFVPYRGAGPALQAVVASQIDLIFDQASNSLPQIRAGMVRGYAVTGPRRLPSAPDLPTVDEAGLPGLYISVWHGLWAPKGTPAETITRINSAVRETLADPAVQHRLTEIGQDIAPVERQTPEGLGHFHKSEIEKWWPIIKAANIKPD